jgi:hypothetical protein
MSESMEAKEKPGYRTSEFWISIAVYLLGALAASGVLADDHIAMKVAGLALAALTSMGYSAARAKTKFGASMERSRLGKPEAE